MCPRAIGMIPLPAGPVKHPAAMVTLAPGAALPLRSDLHSEEETSIEQAPCGSAQCLGRARKAPCGQDSARKGSCIPEGHVVGNGVSRPPGCRAEWASGSADISYRLRYPSCVLGALT